MVRAGEASLPKGLRIFTCGHSFHTWMPPILAEMAKAAGIEGHETVGISYIGGCTVLQHWQLENNPAKEVFARQGGCAHPLPHLDAR